MSRRDIMRGTLAILLMTAFCGAMLALFFNEVPPSNKETLTYAMGQLSGMVTTALAFYFATSKSSADKNDVIASMADNAGQATGRPGDPVNVTEAPIPIPKDDRQPGDL